MCTYTASLAKVQIGNEEPIYLMYTALRAVNFAEAALYAFIVVKYRYERSPAARLIHRRASGLNK
jgi:hypothetical protein